MKYVVYDGILRLTETFYIRSSNRAFRYGDGLFETIHYHKGKLLFWKDHYERLTKGMAAFSFSRMSFPTSVELEAQIIDLLVKNRVFNDGRVRLSIFRRGDGFYRPNNLSASWLIEVEPLESRGFPWYQEGLHIGLYKKFQKHYTPLSPYKTISSNASILASIFAKETRVHDSLILNGENLFIESTSSNLFWVKDRVIFTPAVSSGCVDGVMRKQILEIVKEMNRSVVETKGATQKELLESEEIFLTNVISGIKWVVAINKKRFHTRLTKTIHSNLVEKITS